MVCWRAGLPVARKGAIPGPQRDVGEHALLPQRVQVGQDAVGVRRLVEQRDVHGARAGAGLAILVDGHRHGGRVRPCQVTRTAKWRRAGGSGGKTSQLASSHLGSRAYRHTA